MRDPRSKIVDLDEAVKRARAWRESGLTVGATNGCFDILHRGHCEFLARCRREFCDRLIVLMNSDASVRALKGPDRPVFSQADRAYVLACLEAVDLAMVFDGARCARELRAIAPNLYLKSADWRDVQDISERMALDEAGATCIWLRPLPGYSTTRILSRTES